MRLVYDWRYKGSVRCGGYQSSRYWLLMVIYMTPGIQWHTAKHIWLDKGGGGGVCGICGGATGAERKERYDINYIHPNRHYSHYSHSQSEGTCNFGPTLFNLLSFQSLNANMITSYFIGGI